VQQGCCSSSRRIAAAASSSDQELYFTGMHSKAQNICLPVGKVI